jgi:hypothetical protein
VGGLDGDDAGIPLALGLADEGAASLMTRVDGGADFGSRCDDGALASPIICGTDGREDGGDAGTANGVGRSGGAEGLDGGGGSRRDEDGAGSRSDEGDAIGDDDEDGPSIVEMGT